MKTELTKYNPCQEAVEFRNQFNTFQEAWDACPRGDWMLWIAQKVGVNIHPLTYTKALCAETVIHLMKDERSINAIKVAKRFGKYKATAEELAKAADDALGANAAYTAYTDATYAAWVAAGAAYNNAWVVADYAAYAAYAAGAAFAAAFASGAAARKSNQLLTANICRKHLTKFVIEKLKT